MNLAGSEAQEGAEDTEITGTLSDSGGMAAGTSEGDAHMEEMVDQGLGMEETDQGLPRRPSLKENYHSDSLLAPDTDFMTGTELSQLTHGGPCPPKLLPHLCTCRLLGFI